MGEGSGNECEQECVNYPGGFNCNCFDGFGFVNETHCQGKNNCVTIILHYQYVIDFDECVGEGSGNKCEQGCVNNPGGYDCTCIDGFKLVHDTVCQGRTKNVILKQMRAGYHLLVV